MTSPASTPTTGHAALQPGFADPVLGSQKFFRAALEALSRPGTIVTTDGEQNLGHPAPLHPAAAGLCLTLMDGNTPVWLDCAGDARRDVASWLRFHCGCQMVDDPEAAEFAVVTNSLSMPRLDAFSQGTLRDPHLAATLIIQIGTFAEPDDPSACTLTGPGVEDAIRLAPRGLPEWFRDALIARRELYPQGVDVFLTAGRRMAGLPRSVRIDHDGGAAPCT